MSILCAFCGALIRGAHANRRYCSAHCRELNRGVDCSGCGKRVVRSRTSADSQWCLACRRSGKSPTAHGASGYRRGCRCEVCRAGQAARMREYSLRHSVHPSTQYRRRRRGVDPLASVECVECGEPMVLVTGVVSPRHAECKSGIPGYAGKREFIERRDSGVCQICLTPVDFDAHWLSDWAPTLDHILPRSHGGSHEVENLRLAHRWCNSARRDAKVPDALFR